MPTHESRNHKLTNYGEYTGAPAWRYDECPSCGGKKLVESALCRKCKTATNVPSHPCKDCGKGIKASMVRCGACRAIFLSDKPKCIDCGVTIKRYPSRLTERCARCAQLHRVSLPKPLCSVEGCERPTRAGGMCATHYVGARRIRVHAPRTGTSGAGAADFRGIHKTAIVAIAQLPCQICGYDRMTSHRHRLIEGKDGGKYEIGNVVAVCSNCHREIHGGLTSPPTPLTEDEIMHRKRP